MKLYWLDVYQLDRYFCNKFNTTSLGKDLILAYQENARIYLDEFPEVEEWDYLPLFDNTFVMDRFLRRE